MSEDVPNLSSSFGDTLRQLAATEGDPVRAHQLLALAGQLELAMSKLLDRASVATLDLEHIIERSIADGHRRHQESMAAITQLISYRQQMPESERAKLREIIYATEAEVQIVTEQISDLRARVATLEAFLEIDGREHHVNGG